MTWFRIDDGFHEHTKVELLEDDPIEHAIAVAAWALCGSACARRLTDGVVTRPFLTKTLATWPEKQRLRAAAALVRVGLWVERDDGWEYRDWLERNPSREKVLADRAAAAERKAKSRGLSQEESQRDNPRDTPPPSLPRRGNAAASPDPDPDPVPDRDLRSPAAAALDQVARDLARPPFEPAAAGTDFARLAEVAWTRAVAARGGTFAPDPSGDTPRLRSVAVIVDAQRGSRRLDEALAASATAHLAQRRSGRGTPRSWLEWAQSEASAGTTRNGVSPREDFDPSPVPGRNLDA